MITLFYFGLPVIAFTFGLKEKERRLAEKEAEEVRSKTVFKLIIIFIVSQRQLADAKNAERVLAFSLNLSCIFSLLLN